MTWSHITFDDLITHYMELPMPWSNEDVPHVAFDDLITHYMTFPKDEPHNTFAKNNKEQPTHSMQNPNGDFR